MINIKNKEKINLKFLKVFVIVFIVLFSLNAFAYVPEANMKIFAVNSSKVAMDADLHIKIEEGTGKMYSSINSSVGSSTQESERNAVDICEDLIDNIKGKYNYYFDIESNASSIDGPSAGAAMALLLVSMHSDKDLNGKVSITGTISSEGYVGDVGGIYEKAKKAGKIGIKLFMIPSGNREQMIEEDGEVQLIDLVNYAYSNWDLKIVEVGTIKQVKKYAQMNIDDIDINAQNIDPALDFVPSKIKYSKSLEPMREIVDKYLVDSNNTLNNAESSVTESIIKDSTVTQSLLSFLNYAKSSIKDAQKYSSSNYLYTAANSSYLAQIYSITVDEIVKNPSILKNDSTILDIKLEDLEKKIDLVENRSKLCSLDKMEWCIGAKQRITWSRNKLSELKSNKNSDALSKILDLAYATAWCDIADDFLDVAINNSDIKFVESNYFKNLAQEYIVNIENQLVIVDIDESSDSDLQRRVNAARTNFDKGWYVTSLYDSASALAVLESKNQNNQEIFNETEFYANYNYLLEELRTNNSLNSSVNIWSKLYLDHALMFEESNKFFKDKDNKKADTNLKTANSIMQISKNLYEVENIILEYYNNADIQSIVVEVVDGDLNVVSKDHFNQNTSNNQKQDVYVIANDKSKGNNNFMIYVYMAALFLIVIVVVVELEKQTNKKAKLQKQLSDLDEKLLDGKISEFTYKEMRHRYLLDLSLLKSKVDCDKDILKEHRLIVKKICKIHPSLVVQMKKKSEPKKVKSKTKTKKKSSKK
jgi:uncharacterized protein